MSVKPLKGVFKWCLAPAACRDRTRARTTCNEPPLESVQREVTGETVIADETRRLVEHEN